MKKKYLGLRTSFKFTGGSEGATDKFDEFALLHRLAGDRKSQHLERKHCHLAREACDISECDRSYQLALHLENHVFLPSFTSHSICHPT